MTVAVSQLFECPWKRQPLTVLQLTDSNVMRCRMLQTKATRTDQVAACRRAECDDQAKLFHFHCTQRLVGLPVSVESPTTHTDTHTYS